jgi:hypothetical protein
MDRPLAEATMVAHVGYLAFVVFGGFPGLERAPVFRRVCCLAPAGSGRVADPVVLWCLAW